jgi:hypothetical protein
LPRDHVEYYDYDIEGKSAHITEVCGGIETFGYDEMETEYTEPLDTNPQHLQIAINKYSMKWRFKKPIRIGLLL